MGKSFASYGITLRVFAPDVDAFVSHLLLSFFLRFLVLFDKLSVYLLEGDDIVYNALVTAYAKGVFHSLLELAKLFAKDCTKDKLVEDTPYHLIELLLKVRHLALPFPRAEGIRKGFTEEVTNIS